jgi:uncharacterized SAM-binding protein YcdF (DUF218 family)
MCPRSCVVTVLVMAAAGVALLSFAGSRAVISWVSVPLVTSDRLRPVDAIVVLGAGAHDGTSLTPETASRLLHGLQLFKDGVAPRMILSGGGHRHSRVTDAQAMATVAMTLGVSSAALILDPRPTSTSAQATSVADLARQHGIRSIALVTSPLQSYRAARAFRRSGLDVVSAPGIANVRQTPLALVVAQDHFLGRLVVAIRSLYEYVALAVYWWKGGI